MTTAPPPDVSVGDLIDGKYRVERQIGEGGMGIVLAARHVTLGERYALKILAESSDDTLRKRFLREAQAAARITSEHIARVFDVGMLEGGSPYMVMELLEGEDLDARLERAGPLGLAEAIDYLLQACEALAEAHGLGIVHRDVKPGNLFLTCSETGRPLVKLLDFGISKDAVKSGDDRITRLTRTGSVLGSPQFMAPEQLVSSRDVDPRADVWSLGATLFELLTAEPAFDGHTMTDLYTAILRDPPRSLRALRPELPQEIERIIGRCLEKDVLDRYGTVAELVQELQPFAPEHARASIRRIARSVEPVAPTLFGEDPKVSDGKPPRALMETLLPLVRRLDPVAEDVPPRALMETLLPLVRRIDPVETKETAAVPEEPRSLASAPTAIMEREPSAAGVKRASASPADVSAPGAHADNPSFGAAVTAAARASRPGARPPVSASPLWRMRWPLIVLVVLAVTVLVLGARKYYLAARTPTERAPPKEKRPANEKRKRRAGEPARTWPVPEATGTDDERIPKANRDDAEAWLAAGAGHLEQKQWDHARRYAERVLVLVAANGLHMHEHDSPLAARALALAGDGIALPILPDAPSHDQVKMGEVMAMYGRAEFWDKTGKACVLHRRLRLLRRFAEVTEKQRGPGWKSLAYASWSVIAIHYKTVTTDKRLPVECEAALSELVAFSDQQAKKYTP